MLSYPLTLANYCNRRFNKFASDNVLVEKIVKIRASFLAQKSRNSPAVGNMVRRLFQMVGQLVTMERETRTFGLMEMSAIREMANIGLGHATTALATVSGKSFNMEIPNVETVTLEQVPLMMGDPEAVAIGICMPIDGDISGHTAFLFPWESAQRLWRMLIGTAPVSPDQIDELSASAMLEIGNILSSSFLNAISDLSGLKLHATPPLVSVDLVYTIASTIVAEAELNEAVALAIETRLYETDDESTTGYFLCVPTLNGLKQLFNALGIAEAA